MERKITKLESCHVQVDVVVDKDSWKTAQDKAFKKLAQNVKVDGFRPGKAPEALLRKHVDGMKVLDEAINSLLPDIYREIMEKDHIEPFSQPKVDVTKVSDTELEVKFVITTAPEIKLGAYKDLEIGKKEVKVSAKEVTEAIEELRKSNAILVIKEGEAKEGDTVVFDFVGSVDGKEFEGGSAQNYELELGSHQFIPGFEESLVGVKAGEHRDVKVKFPENYTPELANKDAVFACDVHEVKEKKLPELADEFVKDLGIKGVETLEALKANKKEELQGRKESDAKRDYLAKLYDTIANASKIEIPQEMIDDQALAMRKDMEKRMAQSGLTFEQYLTFVGQKEEEFMDKLKADAKRDITNYFILEEVGKAEQLTLTDADLEFEYAKLAEQYNMKVEDVKKALAAQLKDFKHNVQMTRIEEFLYSNNK